MKCPKTYLGLFILTLSILLQAPFSQLNAQPLHGSSSALFDGMKWIFNGSRIRIADGNPVNPAADPSAYRITGSSITVEAWVYPMGYHGGQKQYVIARPFSSDGNTDPWEEYALFLWNGAPAFAISDGTPGSYQMVTGSSPLPTFTWTHLAGTFDGENIRIIVNGTVTGTAPASGISIGETGVGLYVGRYLARSFLGLIDEVRLWNIVRTPEQIEADMESVLDGATPGLAGYWRLEGQEMRNGVPVTIDETGNHNDLVVQGSRAEFVPFNPVDLYTYPALGAPSGPINFGTVEQASEQSTRSLLVSNSGDGPLLGYLNANAHGVEGGGVFFVGPGPESSKEVPVTLRATAEWGDLSVDMELGSNAVPTTVPIKLVALEARFFDANRIAMYSYRNGVSARDPFTNSHGLRWPKEALTKPMYSLGVWVGATVGGELRVAAASYASDFSPGPILTEAPDPALCRMYRITSESGPGDPDYDQWPGDWGAPMAGETPRLLGDQTLFAVYNDRGPNGHQAFGTPPLGAEVQQTIYGFHRPGHPLDDMVFVRYTIVNRSLDTWENTYLAVWADPDLGDYRDDLAGVDITRNMAYIYNGDDYDDDYFSRIEMYGYGSTPPALGIQMLEGAIPSKAVQAFSYMSASGPNPSRDPVNGAEAYSLMRGLKSDGSPYIDPTTSGATLFPISGDPVSSTGWTDTDPTDRRFLLSTGPITLGPGESKTLVAVIAFGQGADRIQSISALREAVDATSTFVVNSTGDDPDANPGDGIAETAGGECTIRAALEEANAWPGKNRIHFDIPGPGPHTIQYLTPLPVITDPVVIDGTTQPGYDGEPLITLHREWDGMPVPGLEITAGYSTVRGIEHAAGGAGIVLSGMGGNLVEKNVLHCWYEGIWIEESPDNIIGGLTPGSGNLIENNSEGILISGPGSTRNLIVGNTIIGNNHDGILIEEAPGNIIGGTTPAERNIISGQSGNSAIRIVGTGASHNQVLGNYIGVDASGLASLYNQFGIKIDNAPENTIGGTGLGRNVISGNYDDGVNILGVDATGNRIIGNYIGVGADGTTSLGNGDDGINVESSGNIIGGGGTGEGNIISGNVSHGIVLVGASASGNTVLGNFIGTDKTGKTALPNGGGIFIGTGASGNTVGQADGLGANLVAYNNDPGIRVESGTANPILSNTIYSNAGLGIKLGTGAEVTTNDALDGDSGPNNLQNYPELSSVKFQTGSVTIQGSLNSIPETTILLQFFANQVADPSGFGEGQKLLGSSSVTTNQLGNAEFSATFTISTFAGQVITATATDPEGNTSEFSAALGGTTQQLAKTTEFPMVYHINQLGVPSIGSSVFQAVRNAFQGWENIPTSLIDFNDGGMTSARYASATDGINLVTFQDDRFPFSPGVLAVVAKTLEVDAGETSAKIVDADLIFNPAWIDHPKYPLGTDAKPGYFDIWSIAAHEIGHMVGLIHSGVPTATMFFVLKTGTEVRTLEADDIAWASTLYPGAGYGSSFGSISGTITDGNQPTAPVAGALVIATNPSSSISVHAYSDATGAYVVPGLPPGSYKVSIQPLDGSVSGYKMTPANVSPYIYAVTTNVDYPEEFYSGATESGNEESPEEVTSVSVIAGNESSARNLVTNIDIIPPTIIASTPASGSKNIPVTTPIIVKFSEPIDPASFKAAFTLALGGNPVTGGYTFLNSNQTAIFTPSVPLAYGVPYSVAINSALVDAHSNHLAAPFTTSFDTEPPDDVAPTLAQIDPPNGATTIFVTKKITMTFSESLDTTSVVLGAGPGEGTFRLSSSGSYVDGTFAFNQSKTSVVFTPRRTLSEDATYTVELASGITDIAGNGLHPAVTTTFSTITNAAPEILASGPLDGAVGVSISTSMYVDFSEPMETMSVRSASSLTKTEGSVPIPVVAEFLYDDSRLILRPTKPLEFSTTYTLAITTVATDLSGTPIVLPLAAEFSTTAAPSAPSIASIAPTAAIVGSEVVISGAGFDPSPKNNAVVFGGVPSTVIAATLSSITAKVPLGIAAPAAVTVTVTAGGKQSTPYPFTVLIAITDRTNEAVAKVSAESETRDADITPDGGLAYVTNSGSDNVTVIDLNASPPTVTKTIPVGAYPLKIVINPLGTRAYVTNYLSHTVSVIDLSSNSVAKTIPVGLNPIGIATTPDGKRVYIANYTSQDITVIDTDPQSGSFDQAVAKISTESENRDVDVSPDGGLAFVTGTAGLIIINIDPSATDPATGASLYNTAVAKVNTETETREVDVTPDGAFALVTTMAGDILIVDVYPTSPQFGQAVAKVSTENESRDVDVSPDGVLVYVTDYDAGTVSVYEIAYAYGPSPAGSQPEPVVSSEISLKYVTTIMVEDNPDGIVIDQRGNRVVVANSAAGTASIIDITPTSAADATEHLIKTINDLVAEDYVSPGIANSLIAKLKQAYKMITRNKSNTAINILHAFVNEVEALVKGGKLTSRLGERLLAGATHVIWMLSGPDYGQNESVISDGDLPAEFSLDPNYPNPFNPATAIAYDIPQRESGGVHVKVVIFNIVGQIVATVVNEVQQPGHYTVTWDGTSSDGARVSSGIYLCHFSAGSFTKVQKMVLMK